jgi:hypothetical protein
MSQVKNHRRMQIFHFLLRMTLFVAIGMVLHDAQSVSSITRDCPGLWESMLSILVIKCVRMSICSSVVKLLNTGVVHEMKHFSLLNLVVDVIFFTTECVITSKSLNSEECVNSCSKAFHGHPMIAYVNALNCVWDGSHILSHVLFLMLGF